MTNKELIKTKIDLIRDDYLEILLRFVKSLELSTEPERRETNKFKLAESEWQGFIQQSYGCLAAHPIDRGTPGSFESREAIK